MSKSLTLTEKINKILEYCKYTRYLAADTGHKVRYLVEIENTVGDQLCAESIQIGYTADNRTLSSTGLHCAICQAVLDAKQYSQNYNCLSSVKVYIETHDKDGVIVDVEPVDDYEINFERGVEI